jgi:hypothetical protein
MIDFTCNYLLAVSETSRDLSLLLGVFTFAGGLLTMFSHQRGYKATFEQPLTRGEIVFESRKYRRRIVVAGLISSLGLMIACLKWVVEPRQFASLILIILFTLLAIFGMALIDMYSVGLQAITRKKDINRQQLIEDYMERKKAEHASQSVNRDESETG